MHSITILPGFNKSGVKEQYDSIEFNLGELCAIVGPTGAGKSRFIKDIEMLVRGDSVTRRIVLIDGKEVIGEERESIGETLIAHLGQNMRFTLDLSVREFLEFHSEVNEKKNIELEQILSYAGALSGEPFSLSSPLFSLSGGQSRALMTADIAFLSDRPIVLIDEIENAGIDKEAALSLLIGKGKLVFLVTHDSHTALMAAKRVVIKEGAVECVRARSKREEELFNVLNEEYKRKNELIRKMRRGDEIVW